jgi:spore coat-associated protein N
MASGSGVREAGAVKPSREGAKTMIRRILISLIAINALATCASIGGLSLFTKSVDNGNNTFTSGSVDISTSPASAFITMSSMAPGDSVTQQLTVANAGTLELRYAMTTSATNTDSKNLRDALILTIKTKGTNCTTFDGTSLYSGTLTNGAIGNPTQGNQSGDRTLAATVSEDLCFKVELPSSATGPEGATTTATFTFAAEQTKNN